MNRNWFQKQIKTLLLSSMDRSASDFVAEGVWYKKIKPGCINIIKLSMGVLI